jgi:hypothetical protein
MEENIQTQNTEVLPANVKLEYFWLVIGVLAATAGVVFPPALIVVPAILAYAAFRTRGWAFALFAVPIVAISYYIFSRITSGGEQNFFSTAFTAFGMYQSWTDIIIILAMNLLPALSLYILQKYSFGNFNATFYLSAIFFAVFAAAMVSPSLREGKGLYGTVLPLCTGLINALKGIINQFIAADPANAAIYNNLLADFFTADELASLTLPLIYSAGAVLALANALLLHAFNGRKKKAELCPLQPFGQWRFQRKTVSTLCVMMIAALLLSWFGVGGAAEIAAVFQQMLLLPLGLVGLAAIWRFSQKRRWVFVVTILGLIFIGSFILLLLAAIALLTGAVGFRRKAPPPKEE